MEAMACGIPCVAFRQGGVPELVDHEVSGYLAQPYDPGSLARGIVWVLEDEERRAGLARQARLKAADCFALDKVARQYAGLYRRMLDGEKRKGGGIN
jgi:glycosyltransferase involved in cell wall biosynthesis